jgi:hypothetical protein
LPTKIKMPRESSGTNFRATVFKFCANIINVVLIAICTLEDQKLRVTLKSLFFGFTKYFNISSLEGRQSGVIFHGFFKLWNSKYNEFFLVLG